MIDTAGIDAISPRIWASLANALTDSAIILTDDTGIVRFWSTGAEHLTGFSSTEALFHFWPKLLRASSASSRTPLELTQECDQRHPPHALTIQSKLDHTLEVTLTTTPLAPLEGQALFALRVKPASPHDQDDREIQFAEALRRAEAANLAKSQFLSNISHELRTPPTAILGFVEFLAVDGDLTKAPLRRRETIATIREAGNHLLDVVNTLLDLAKIDADELTIEPSKTDLLRVLIGIDSLLQPRARAKNLNLHWLFQTNLPSIVIVDTTRIRQILMKLIGNAIKFTEYGNIAIQLSSATLGNDVYLQFDVKDTGPGLSTDDAEALFIPFTQADTSCSRRHGGVGVGLAIARQLARAMGGDVILADSILTKGSTFRFTLKAGIVKEAIPIRDLCVVRQSARQKTSSPHLSGSILVAEDGKDNQTLIAFHLRRAGAKVDVADNGQRALEMIDEAGARNEPYDLLLTDIQMPEMDGLQLVQTLRARKSRLAIVALTAHSSNEDRKRCMDAGCDEFTTKPIDRDALIESCARWIGRVSSQGETRRTNQTLATSTLDTK